MFGFLLIASALLAGSFTLVDDPDAEDSDIGDSKNPLEDPNEILEQDENVVAPISLPPEPIEEPIVGTDDDESIFGTEGVDTIYGEGGDDKINGDSEYIYSDQDEIFGGDGNDTIVGNGTLSGENGDDVISIQYPYGDALYTSDNLIEGGAGNDTIKAIAGHDTIFGGEGDDSIVSGSGGLGVVGADPDWVSGGSGNDIIFGRGGNDTLLGDEGDDTLVGGSGHDSLLGGAGDDELVSNLFEWSSDARDGDYVHSAQDTLDGGDGSDTFKIVLGPSNFEQYFPDFFSNYLDSDEDVPLIVDFDPSEDVILFDTAGLVDDLTELQVSVEVWDNGGGADILVNGAPLVKVEGAANIDANSVMIV